MLTKQDVIMLVDDIDLGTVLYKSWRFRVLEKGDGFLLQLVYEEADTSTPPKAGAPEEEQHARKWYISAHATPAEVVRTAYKAVLCSLEHRLGEHFRYKGVQIYSPHPTLETMLGAATRPGDRRNTAK